MLPTNEPTAFRSGLRRLLYPATNRQLPTEGDPQSLAELAQRLDLTPADWQVLPLRRRTLDGRFVDVTSGEVVLEAVDIDIPSPIHFQWKRYWRSNQLTGGSLGNGWRHHYDFALIEDRRSHQVLVRLPDNRGVTFPLLMEGEEALHRAEKLWLSRDSGGYQLRDAERLVYRFADNPSGSVCRLTALATAGISYQIRFSYTSAGHLRRISDDFQRAIEVTTDPQGRISRLEMAAPDQPLQRSLLVAYQYDEGGNLTEVTGPNRRLAHYVYRHNRPLRLTDAARRVVFFTYESTEKGLRCIETKGGNDPAPVRLRYLTAEGITQVTDQSGGVRQYVHEAGIVQRYISAAGRPKVWFFNEYGELLSEQDALGNTSFFAYDERGQLTQAAWPDGGTMQMQYNDDGQLGSLMDRADGTWVWTYDERGRPFSCADPAGALTQFMYRADGLPETIKRANGQWIRFAYDAYANRTVQMDSVGNRFVWTYDFLGQLTTASEPDGAAQPSLAGAQSATEADSFNGSSTVETFSPTYDADGRLIRLRRGNRLNWQFIRDAAGRVREYIRPDGQSTRFHYDAVGRVTEVLFEDGTWYHYTYRPDGRLIEAATPNTAVQFERNPLGQILTETGASTVVQAQYDPAGRRVSLQSSAGANVRYEHDEMGRLASQVHPGGTVEFSYDRWGRPAERQMPGGLRSRWQYDSGRLPVSHQLFWGSSLQSARVQTYGWTGQQLTRLGDNRFGTVNLRYDGFNEPIEAISSTGWTERWVAERAAYQRRLLKPAPEYSERGWQVMAVGPLCFYYDANGYLREKRAFDGRVWQFRWHEGGVLQAVIIPDGQVVTFGYDALGRRTEKQFADHQVRWCWDGARLLHEWHQRSGSDLTGLTWYTAGSLGDPTILQIADQSYSLITNYLGQPLSLHNEQGEPVWAWGWCLFGKKRNLTGPARWHTILGRGQYEDAEAGLIYADFRYYDAETGLPLSPEYSSPAGWARSGWEPPHAPESYLSAGRYIRAY